MQQRLVAPQAAVVVRNCSRQGSVAMFRST